ncbi:MAG: hypothetical protein NZM40_04280 [Sphingomonadaceae bacterium]|uniref:inositol monophosphatase family protein n=1 Tax=Thermaurantiacus sp. TaxID=2820283 RepID=UPI00298F25A5|nr:inositol monophosphatase family protein [Thermaurantiacus sp.]MCS6986640.1 hypothetical protein [Sphingomonadaceae bacterium]MDW8414098.1 inositol monophosphatase family protein [Thermaurantiacus sp.]
MECWWPRPWGLTFAATRAGATCNGQPIAVARLDTLDVIRLPVEPAFASFWSAPWRVEPVHRPNSQALRMALVASGEAHGMVDGRATHEWDVAAASLIVEAAGGRVTDREGVPFRFNKPRPQVAGIVAATPALHEPLARRLADLRAALHRAGVALERDG